MKIYKIGIVSYYTVETSPSIINFCSYLVDRGYDVDLVIIGLRRSKSFTLSNVTLIQLIPSVLLNDTIRRHFIYRFKFLMKYYNWVFTSRLKRIINSYDCVFCIEFEGLDAVVQTGYDLTKCIYFSLEAIACTRPYDIDYVKKAISGCAFSIIASKEKGKDLEKYFEIPIDFEYVPVSLRRPQNLREIIKKKERKNNGIYFIQSGYFAGWTCLHEFIDVYKEFVDINGDCKLYLHGHKIGTDKYYRTIISKIKHMNNVFVDLTYYSSNRHLEFLSQFDIGLAFYKNYINSTDWENLIFSSGKIASYLWAGLAVLTNISHPLTMKPPFLFINPISFDTLSNAIKRFREEKEMYLEAAIKCANKYYNMDLHMEKIVRRMEAIMRQ